MLWYSEDYDDKVIVIPQYVESEPTTLQPDDLLKLTYYAEQGRILGLSSAGTWDKISRDMFSIGHLEFKIVNHLNQEIGLEKLLVNECSYPVSFGVSFGCYRVVESGNYTFTMFNKGGFDLEIPSMQFGIFDGERITEIDYSYDDGDFLPLVGYEVLVIASAILIMSGFALRYYNNRNLSK